MKKSEKQVSSIKFRGLDTVEKSLKQMRVAPQDYHGLISESLAMSPNKGRLMLKGLINIAPDVKAHLQILDSTRRLQHKDIRKEVVKSYTDTGKKMELISGLSTMTTNDASLFFKDYFEIGGTTKDVTDWLNNISAIYVAKKRSGEIDPAYDGFWSDCWDAITDVVDTVGEAIMSVVDSVLEAGKTFADIASDLIDYAQNRINDIVETLLDAGREIGEFLTGVVEGIAGAVAEGFTKVFKAILAAGRGLLEILEALYSDVVDFVKDGIDVLIKIGCRIKNILARAWEMTVDTFKEVVGFIIDLGHSVWYILKWAVKQTLEIIQATFEKMLEIGKSVCDLVAWCARRSLEVIKKGFEVLIAMGNTLLVITTTLITDPKNVFKKGFQALKELGASVYDFVQSAASLGTDIMKRTWDTLKEIGCELLDFLEYGLAKGYDIFIEIVTWLFKVGVKVFDILLWAIEKSFEVFGWVLEAFDSLFDSFLDIIEWVLTDVGGEWIGNLAHWLAEKARGAVDWFIDKVIQPILAIGKMMLVIILASTNIVFLAIAYFALKSLVDKSKTDYLNWPATLAGFNSMFIEKMKILPDVDADHKYVIFSDVHKESQNDVDSGLGHFYRNKALYQTILNKYADDPAWTVISAGDDEEFWYTGDLSSESDPINKVQPIIDNNKGIYDTISTSFYKNQTPRRFYKIRGNHDDIWSNGSAVNKLKDDGFPDLHVYDYVIFKRNGRDTLVMHGHQFDPYNCDANNFFGKFASNFVGESIDEMNDTLVSIFGDGARIEGWSLAPFYQRDEWEAEWEKFKKDYETAPLANSPMFDEREVFKTIRQYDCNLIIGHTHDAKVVIDSQINNGQLPERFYANSGTCGWWEDCIWSLEVTEKNVTINAWTHDHGDTPFCSFSLADNCKF